MSIKVSNVNQPGAGGYPVRGPDMRGSQSSGMTVFHRTLTDVSREQLDAQLTEMKNEIEKQGAILGDRADVKEFEKYRKLIREFLDEIVSNGYTFVKEDTYASRGRHRFIATVMVVNEKLDELGKEVLKENADKIELISRIDEIRGLLLDLMI